VNADSPVPVASRVYEVNQVKEVSRVNQVNVVNLDQPGQQVLPAQRDHKAHAENKDYQARVDSQDKRDNLVQEVLSDLLEPQVSEVPWDRPGQWERLDYGAHQAPPDPQHSAAKLVNLVQQDPRDLPDNQDPLAPQD